MPTPVDIPDLLTATLGFAVFLLGVLVTRRIAILREFNIPEPVTGGLIAAAFFGGAATLFNVDFVFEMESRDLFLVMFFAAIGLNARLSDLVTGGRLLLILLGLTLLIVVIQNIVGILGARLFDMPFQTSVLFGSAALIGGHGTAIAWAPEVDAVTGMGNAAELGIAAATLGLVVASLVGGPVARFLIARGNLTPERPDEEHTVGFSYDADSADHAITHVSIMQVMLALNVAIILGFGLRELIEMAGLKLPLFVPCLIVGIVIGNLHGLVFPKATPVSRTPGLAVISDFALGAFLAISLMTIDFGALAGLGLPLVTMLTAQTLVAVLFVLFVLFPLLGRNYRAAVLSAGFSGFALGATPTAIANMTAVTKRYGPSPVAFVVLPLVSAFFVDLANAVVIQMIVNF